ncbi:hypothetical protein [Hymenobacter siberiensis]|uniref:hypothetical protein n=1 Tax=Hymenobacter siberiensis TaxID=2848396 RepID=UPI001C1E62EB|nr:hypothetical protein [Hymenobacter siberiensis]
MKSFISLIYIKTNPVSDEKICIGIFVGGEERNIFAWSDSKLKICTKLVSGDIYPSLSKTFINISKDAKESDSAENGLKKLFIDNYKYSHSYFEYLNRYNDGIIEFKEPKILPKQISDDDFKKLFKLYVGESIITPKDKHETFYKKVKSHLLNPVFAQKTNLNYKIPEEVIGTIYRPQLVDFISCNGNILAGNAIDFSATPSNIESKLYEFRALVQGLKQFARNKNFRGRGKYTVYFDSPTGVEQSKILNNAYKDDTKDFDMKPIEDIDDVVTTLESHDYKKFSEIITL